jgi:acetyltransferase EpsM
MVIKIRREFSIELSDMILFGASSHGKIVADILRVMGEEEIMFWDDNPASGISGYELNAPRSTTNDRVIISIGNNGARKRVAETYSYRYGKAIHPGAVLSADIQVGEGTVIMPVAVINAGSKIGRHCIINTAAVIEHNCRIDDYVHISPSATLCGNVAVNEGGWIGAGATIIQNLTIGKWAVIGAGSVVLGDIPDYAVAVGNPAKVIRYNRALHPQSKSG